MATTGEIGSREDEGLLEAMGIMRVKGARCLPVVNREAGRK